MFSASTKILFFLIFQAAANITLADLIYVLGLVVTLIGLFGGFAKVVTKITILQTTVDLQAQTILELKGQIKDLQVDVKKIEREIVKLEK